MSTREIQVNDEHEAVDPHAGTPARGSLPRPVLRSFGGKRFLPPLRLKIWRLSNLCPGTQADLAKRLGVSEWSVSGWESGKRSPSPRNRAAIKRLTEIDWGTP